MIQIFVDMLTNKINGYNTIVSDNIDENDGIFVEDDKLLILESIIGGIPLYYVDGEIKKENSEDVDESLYNEILELEEELQDVQSYVTDEHKIFMDNILSGMDMKEATAISQSNRNKVEELKNRREELDKQYKDATFKKINSIFEKEEKDLVYKYFLSGLVIMRDENDYVEEWLRYHIEEHNFDHFYIYDNESKISVKEYLESVNFKYLDKLTIIDWPTSKASQEDSHNDFLDKYAKETQWFIGFDPDEYIILKDNSKSLVDFLNENNDYATIKCLWVHYNANGHETKTDEPDMIRFTQTTNWHEEWHGGKKFAQSNRVRRFQSYMPLPRLDAKEADFDNEITTKLQLNHYYTRSYEEWLEKIKRGSSNPKFLRKYSDFFELNPDMKYLNTHEEILQTYGSQGNKDENLE